MLRVLTLSTLFPNSAQPTLGVFVEQQTLRLAARADVDLRIVSPLGLPPVLLDRHPRYAKLRALPHAEDWKGVPIARPRYRMLPGLSGAQNPWLVYRAAKPILAKLRRDGFAFDIIDAEFFYPDGPAAMRLARDFDVPFSIKARGADIHYWGSRPACRRQMLEAAARADGMLAVAASLQRDMAKLGMPEDRIRVHYTGVDLDRFHPVDRAAAKAKLGVTGPLLISLGALIPRKAHHLVIEAMQDLPGATLLVVGEGSERPRYEALIAALGLADRVRLTGNRPHTEIPNLLAAADVMALASRSEGLANAWVEALACGTPIIIPNVDGAPEVVATPAAGRLIDERTPTAIAAAIRALLADPPTSAATRAVAERFAWHHNTDALYSHLIRIAARPRSP